MFPTRPAGASSLPAVKERAPRRRSGLLLTPDAPMWLTVMLAACATAVVAEVLTGAALLGASLVGVPAGGGRVFLTLFAVCAALTLGQLAMLRVGYEVSTWLWQLLTRGWVALVFASPPLAAAFSVGHVLAAVPVLAALPLLTAWPGHLRRLLSPAFWRP